MQTDRYGLVLSTSSQGARDAYIEGCDLILSGFPGADAAFDRAIAVDRASHWLMSGRRVRGN